MKDILDKSLLKQFQTVVRNKVGNLSRKDYIMQAIDGFEEVMLDYIPTHISLSKKIRERLSRELYESLEQSEDPTIDNLVTDHKLYKTYLFDIICSLRSLFYHINMGKKDEEKIETTLRSIKNLGEKMYEFYETRKSTYSETEVSGHKNTALDLFTDVYVASCYIGELCQCIRLIDPQYDYKMSSLCWTLNDIKPDFDDNGLIRTKAFMMRDLYLIK